ncbi:hypothetical protein ACEN8K_36970, partial [Variovorax sp. CT11-76]
MKRGAGARFAEAFVAMQHGTHRPGALREVVRGACRVVPRARPADQQHAMVARMHQRMGGREVAVRPARVVHEGQHLEHAAPEPDRMGRIDALRVGALHVEQAAPVAGRMAQHQRLAAVFRSVVGAGRAQAHG